MSLIATGSIGIDTVHTDHGSAEKVLGGSCAYFAAAACHQAPVRIVAAVGGDWPDEHRGTLAAFDGIDQAGLEERPDSTTFAWGGRYETDMNDRETLFTDLGVLDEPGPAVPESFRDSQYVFLANTHPAEQARLLEHFPDRKIAVVDTMDLWINIAHDDLTTLLQRVDGLVLNDAEAALLTERRNPVTAGRRLLEMGPKFVVVKKGEHGCLLVHQDGLAALPAFPRPQESVVDPTGAGDSFAGGMMGYLAREDRTDMEAIQTALAWGTVTASFTIESFSLGGLIGVDRAAIDERMEAFQAIARVG
ncbi:MAG: PfkB family carbohydrate kinase [Phycisphaerales bacterium]